MVYASVLSGVSDAITGAIGDHGVYAVFLLMRSTPSYPPPASS